MDEEKGRGRRGKKNSVHSSQFTIFDLSQRTLLTPQREDIHLISRHGKLPTAAVDKWLKAYSYNQPAHWFAFLRWFLLSLGAGFTLAGIIFFFAYNWQDLHKFAKLGIIGFLLSACVIALLVLRTSPLIKNLLLTAACVLTGVLFAVFGQIYQTGANAFDFFMAWSLCITLWVVVSRFAPLWLIYLTLLNITLVLYSVQVAADWETLFVFFLLTFGNLLVLLFFTGLKIIVPSCPVPGWFTHLLALYLALVSNIGIHLCIHDYSDNRHAVLLMMVTTLLCYGAGALYVFRMKSLFYLSVIAFSLIIIGASALLKASVSQSMLLFISVYIIGSVTLVIYGMLKLQQNWRKADE